MSEMERHDAPTGPVRPRQPSDFDALYQGAPPWDIGRPQPAYLELAQAGAVRGRVLDVGCGTGEHALMAAGLGLEATGIDVAAAAIAIAERKARERASLHGSWSGTRSSWHHSKSNLTLCSTAGCSTSSRTTIDLVSSTALERSSLPAAATTCCASATASRATGDQGASPRTRSGKASQTGGGWTRSTAPPSTSRSTPTARSRGGQPSAEPETYSVLLIPLDAQLPPARRCSQS